MPELPEVETVRQGLLPAMEGRRFELVEAKRADLRFPLPPDFAKRLTGRRMETLSRRGKYLVGRLDDGALLIMHLGMSGRFTVLLPGDPDVVPGSFHNDAAANAHARHEHIVFRMEGGGVVRYSDPRRFGFMVIEETGNEDANPFLQTLGPEPLSETFTPEVLAAALRGKKTPLKSALLDQTVVAGLGNIYVCEALFRAHLSPRRLANSITRADGRPTERLIRLVDAIKAVLAEAIEAGGSSLRDHARADGTLGYFQHRFAVYDREGAPCPNGCGSHVARIVQSGRSTFHCRKCQR